MSPAISLCSWEYPRNNDSRACDLLAIQRPEDQAFKPKELGYVVANATAQPALSRKRTQVGPESQQHRWVRGSGAGQPAARFQQAAVYRYSQWDGARFTR